MSIEVGVMATMREVGVVERVYWTVPGSYHAGDEFGSFAEAVAAARERQCRIDIPQVESEPRWSRACVALRQSSRYAPANGCGNDAEVVRWEVYPDRVVLVPTGQGGLSNEQRDTALAVPASAKGWA